jgi:preprotein translocase subunit SecA
MTGTAREVRNEILEVYRLHTIVVPPHRPCRRQREATLVAPDSDGRWRLVADRAEALAARGRPVLIGTRSVADSEALSAVLRLRSVPHRVLNALQDAGEAELVKSAGRPGTVTVATSMAGRGTDIKLDAEVAACGGLHVILTAPHESRRVDRQLFGRAARQGDPGSAQSILAANDRLIGDFAPLWTWIIARCSRPRARRLSCLLARIAAQRSAEALHRKARRAALAQDRRFSDLLSFSGRV